MEDEVSNSLEGKDIGNLRVIDLKQELEKRGLSKSGSKKELVKRLKQQVEFEKLCEERRGSGDYDLKLELDAATEQNEFVQQYLAQQQKRYAERKEEKLQLNETQTAADGDSDQSTQKLNEENSKIIGEDCSTSEETKFFYSDVKSNNERSQSCALAETEESINSSNNCSVELKLAQYANISGTIGEGEEEESQSSHIEELQNVIKQLNNSSSPISNTNELEKDKSELDISKNKNNTVNNLIVLNTKTVLRHDNLYAPDSSENIDTEIHGSVVSSNASQVVDEQNNLIDDSKDLKNIPKCSLSLGDDRDMTDQVQNSGITENTKSAESKSRVSQGKTSPHRSSSDNSSSELSCPQNISNMESSQCSSVPYSLSDIQLPESPVTHCAKSKLVKSEENFSKTDSVAPDIKQVEHLDCKVEHLDSKVKSNGMSMLVPDNLNSSRDVSESEIQVNSESDDVSRKKQNQKKEHSSFQKEGHRTSKNESSDRESDANEDQLDKRELHIYDNTSSILISDSKEQSKDSLSKEEKTVKMHQKSEESENEKSTDSERYKHRHVDSKHKSHSKHRKRNRRSRSQSSSSSSSDSSPKRRRSKKSSATKSKKFVENIESSEVLVKNTNVKSSKHEDSSKVTDSISNDSSKRRLKIKRDNVPVEISSPNVESSNENSVTRKSIDQDTLPSSSTSGKLSKQESPESKEKEISYVPRKVSLSNRKLNRKSSEDKSSEQPKSKKSKWGSFAAAQKATQTISISTDSLKNWFPDFKLISESTTAVELEPDETSLSPIEDKNSNLPQADGSNENDTDVKQDPTSQMEVQDVESQEQNMEDISEQGPVSKCIFIQNLVRPFTLNQLKELLKQYGKTVEEFFWIDKIKSKCFVMYETEKEAAKARNALNNTRWPSSNPKILTVEFSDLEELEQHKKGNDVPPKTVIEQPIVEPQEMPETRVSRPIEEPKRRDRDRRKDKERSKPHPPIREWDKDKIVQESPERERIPKEEKSRSSEKKEKKESKKRANEDTPAKLLDDLFQKTKSAPCIYWLPLTEEQAKQKDEERRLRKIEREKRHQQFREQEEAEHRNRTARSSRRSREKENRKSSTRSRSPVTRRR